MYHSVHDEKLNLLTWAIRLIFSEWVTFGKTLQMNFVKYNQNDIITTEYWGRHKQSINVK